MDDKKYILLIVLMICLFFGCIIWNVCLHKKLIGIESAISQQEIKAEITQALSDVDTKIHDELKVRQLHVIDSNGVNRVSVGCNNLGNSWFSMRDGQNRAMLLFMDDSYNFYSGTGFYGSIEIRPRGEIPIIILTDEYGKQTFFSSLTKDMIVKETFIEVLSRFADVLESNALVLPDK